ncbi:MAG: DUF4328 domain-containing protein [Pirellulales bacterium]|nr:DUF4328 domain-containing protein [Pirellulales bacterium]
MADSNQSQMANPYQSPTLDSSVDPEVPQVAVGDRWIEVGPYRSIRILSRILIALLIANLIGNLVMAMASFLQVLQPDMYFAGEGLSPLELVIAGVAFGTVIVYLTTAVTFLRWVYRVHSNLPALGAKRLDFSNGWSVGWFFVPILNLWKPYQVMKENFRGSLPGASYDGDDSIPIPSWLWTWWMFYVVSGIGNRVSHRISTRIEDPTILQSLAVFEVALSVWDVALTLLALWVVWRISSLQETKATAAGPQLY